MNRLVALALATVMLAACQSSHAQKPIPMTNGAMQYFADWAAYPHAKAFAVSENGRTIGATYCPEFGGCAGSGEQDALSMCESGSKGSPCKIYGIGGRPIVEDATLEAYLAAHKGDRSFHRTPTARPDTRATVTQPRTD